MSRAADEPMVGFDAWTAARQMGMGVNIGNTLENTTRWETGWGNPRITKQYIAHVGKRLPVLWETGGDISRQPPYAPSPALREALEKLGDANSFEDAEN